MSMEPLVTFSNLSNSSGVSQMGKRFHPMPIQWKPMADMYSNITCLHTGHVMSSKHPEDSAVQFVSKQWRSRRVSSQNTHCSILAGSRVHVLLQIFNFVSLHRHKGEQIIINHQNTSQRSVDQIFILWIHFTAQIEAHNRMRASHFGNKCGRSFQNVL